MKYAVYSLYACQMGATLKLILVLFCVLWSTYIFATDPVKVLKHNCWIGWGVNFGSNFWTLDMKSKWREGCNSSLEDSVPMWAKAIHAPLAWMRLFVMMLTKRLAWSCVVVVYQPWRQYLSSGLLNLISIYIFISLNLPNYCEPNDLY